jgi:hypothetical protein
MALYVTLPGHLYYGPVWLLPAVETALVIALLTTRQMEKQHHWHRAIAICLIASVNAANIGSLALLVHGLIGNALVNGHKVTAQHLMVWAAQIWLTNVIVFARSDPHHREPDLLFPQMANPDSAPAGWTPSFIDYIYTSFTNAAAFSPTGTMPLSEWAKILFMIQSLTSMVTVVLVAARIANILP